MAFRDMIAELRGAVPKIPMSYCMTVINRAYQDVRRQNLWSFQIYDSNWIAPSAVNTGLVTTVQGSSSVVLNAAANAAVQASITLYNPINQRQFRVGVSTICNITGYDNPTATLTLDRGFPDPGGIGQAYQVYQVYYPAPYRDHLMFISVRDMVGFCDLVLNKNMIWLNERDPQRTWYFFPTHVVPYLIGTDPANTATYQFPLFELWGVPLSNRAYQIFGIRKGLDLVNPTDVLPVALTEECLMAMAKFYAYEWAEANKGAIPRNQGPDFKYLMGETKARYNELFRKLRMQDRMIVDNWFSIRRSSLNGKTWAQYNTISGTAYPGTYVG